MPLAIEIHTRAAGVRHPRVESRVPFRALHRHGDFHVFKFLNFRVSTPTLYPSTLLYPSKMGGRNSTRQARRAGKYFVGGLFARFELTPFPSIRVDWERRFLNPTPS